MKRIKRKQLILSLIKDDLLHAKLVNGLNGLGLDAKGYYLHLSDTVFLLMGFGDDKRGDKMYELYLSLCKRVEEVDVLELPVKLEELADEIYKKLLHKNLS